MTKEKYRIGLSSEQARESAEKFGTNKLDTKGTKTFLSQFLGAFNDPIIKILLAALLINIIFWIKNFDPWETLGIGIAVLLSTFISAASEYGSEKAYASLLSESENSKVTVYRDGVPTELFSKELVVGDAVILRAGEKIRADGYIFSGHISVDQSALNGESEEVQKYASSKPSHFELADSSCLFSGTLICSGEGIMTVTAVGKGTYYGGIAGELAGGTGTSPLKEKLTALAKTISKYGYISALLVAFADIFNSLIIDNGFNTSAIMTALSSPSVVLSSLLHAITLALTVVIVAVPEGLPMMIGVVLSRNISKMKKDNVMVRTPVGIETAGGINILFTDKTGTLTEGKMCVCGIVLSDGTITQAAPEHIIPHYAVSCIKDTACTEISGGISGGTPTDRALFSSALKYKKYAELFHVICHEPFSSDKKYSSVTVMYKGRKRTYIKGAPDILLSKCTHCINSSGTVSAINRGILQKAAEESGKQSYRCLMSAYKEDAKTVFVCMVRIADGVRKESKNAVSSLRSAGVNVVMITGDNEQTARSVAEMTGIINTKRNISLTGQQLSEMSDEQVQKILPNLAVIARAYPSDKSRMVRICKRSGLVVGMTGDGINDSPALRCADVGFAMGSGCDVAKEAGDVVILDDNISSIAKTVLYGRTIFKSIKKFLVFQLTMNFCAVAISMLAPLIGCETPVTVIQMLWINIIMDTLAALAFAGEQPRTEYMREKPIKRNEKVLTSQMKQQIAFTGTFSTALMVWFLKSEYVKEFFGYYHFPTAFYCGFFGLFVFSGVFNCFNTRTHRINLTSHLAANRSFCFIIASVMSVQLLLMYFGGDVFRCTPLTPHELLFILLLSSLVIPVDIIRKLLSRKKEP